MVSLIYHNSQQQYGAAPFFFKLNAQVLNHECKCVHVHNLDLKSSTLFTETTSIGREFHIPMTDGKKECW